MRSIATRQISLAHGGGGQLTDDLLHESILPRLGGGKLDDLMDAAHLDMPGGGRVALTVDGYVVQPTFFPGGDVGRLAISGTVNDLAVTGARPLAIALGMILEEGTPIDDLERVLDSIASTAIEAGVDVVTGDTKVVGRGAGDGIYLTTAGVGVVAAGCELRPARCRAGDVVLINGPIADHGLTVMLAREMPEFESDLRSDVAPLAGLIECLLAELGDSVVFMRDATRSGLAGVGAELARQSSLRVQLEETKIPVRPQARRAADLLGLDPLEIANEGKVVIVVRPDAAERALALLRTHPLGCDAAVIGSLEHPEPEVTARCELITRIGGRRLLAKPYGEQLPRIC